MKKFLFLILVLCLIYGKAFTADKVIYLTSLNWPPYTGEKIPHQGMVTTIVKAAYKEMGYEVKVDFYPWQRAVKSLKEENKYIGCFPEYHSKDREKNFIFSVSLGSGTVGLVEKKDNIIKWNQIKDLKNYKIGIVNGYVNTEEFDKMIERKEVKVEIVSDDIQNIKKVAVGGIDAAVIDKNVLEFFLSTDSESAELKKSLQFNQNHLEVKNFYVCFKKNEEGRKYA